MRERSPVGKLSQLVSELVDSESTLDYEEFPKENDTLRGCIWAQLASPGEQPLCPTGNLPRSSL